MPSKSAKQAKFMRAVSHSPQFAKKVGVSQSVGKDFEMADKKTKKFGSGGRMPPQPTAADRAASKRQDESLKKAKVSTDEAKVIASANRSEGTGTVKKMAKGGSASARADGIAKKGKTKGTEIRMAAGGVPGKPAMTGLNRAAAMSGRTFKKGGMSKKGCK